LIAYCFSASTPCQQQLFQFPLPPLQTGYFSEVSANTPVIVMPPAKLDTRGVVAECLIFGLCPSILGNPPKKLVVKGGDFPYQFGQMHRVGARGKPFLPQSEVYKKCVPKQ
jgi:hypothetical protein